MAEAPDNATDPDAVVEEYLRRVDAGEQVDQEAFLAQHAEVAPALRSFFANEQLMRQWKADATPAGDTAQKDALPTIPPKAINASLLVNSPGSLKLPVMMGRYRIDKELGRGAMGAVFLAHDSDLDRPVALKIPKFGGEENPELIARFVREARSAAVLAHPNICRVYDVSEHQGVRYIAMEYIEGKPLSAFIAAGSVQPKQAATVIRKLAQGLAEAHSRGIIHRDLKPDNILVNKNGEPVLTDFGLARGSSSSQGNAQSTQDGVILGSPAYMPPEQAAGNLSDMGPTSDVYSLGVVLYELLTGEIPFRGSVVEVLASVLMKTPKTVRELKPEIDPGLAAICDKMMAKKAKDRYQSMTEVANALNEWLKTASSAKPAAEDAKSKLGTPHVVQPKKPGEANQSIAPLTMPASKQTLSPKSKPGDGVAGTVAGTKSPAAAKVPERTPQQLAELADLVEQLLARNDYLEAIPILEQIPDYQRTPKLRQLLGEAYELKGTVEKLERNLEKHLNLLDIPELKKTVDKLLKIHPSHKRGKEIRKALNTEGKRGVVNILKNEGNYHGGGFAWEWWQVAAAGGSIAALFAAVSYAVFVYIQGATGVLEIEIDDPTAIVKVDGKTATINAQGTGEIRVAYGNLGYTVEQGGTTVVSDGKYEFQKNGQRVLKISLKNTKPGDGIAATAPVTKPAASGYPKVFDGHTGAVLAVCVSPDSKNVYSGSGDATVRGWDVATGKEVMKFTSPQSVGAIAVSPNGKLIAVSGNPNAHVIDAATGKEIHTLKDNGGTQGITFTPDNRQVIDASIDFTAGVWNVETGDKVKKFTGFGVGFVVPRVSPDGAVLFMGAGSGIHRWKLATDERMPDLKGQGGAILGLELTKDGRYAISASDLKTVGYWNAQTGELLALMEGHTGRVMAADFFPGGKYAVSGGLDKKMILWNLETRQKEKEWPAHETSPESLGVRGLAVAPNGEFIVSGGYDSKVRIWKSPVEAASAKTPSGNAPPLALAPFNAAQAKAHQEAWAKHLGVPVEYTNSLGMKFRLIPPGEFTMGGMPEEIKEWATQWDQNDIEQKDIARAEGPQHKVRLTKPYYLGMHEVTQKDYETIVGKNPAQHRADSENADVRNLLKGLDTARFPVENVSWIEVQDFCQKLSQKESQKLGYRLPTEAEWEYACRAGTTTRNWNGDSAQDAAAGSNFEMNRPRVVGELKANPFGMYDMNGNVWEWVQDWWNPDYYQQFANQTAVDPTGPATGKWRGIRGCSLGQDALRARSALRFRDTEQSSAGGRGFRIVLPVEVGKTVEVAEELPAPPVISKFISAQAKAHQAAWAKHLGVPVEYTNSVGMKFRLIPPGEYMMGSTPEETDPLKKFNPDGLFKPEETEQPRHRVRITKPFWLGQYEVTRGEFAKFATSAKYTTSAEKDGVGAGRLTPPGETDKNLNWRNTGWEAGDNHPVVNVTWNDAQAFAEWLGKTENKKYRIATDAEWEYACRAGSNSVFPWGDDPSEIVRYANVPDQSLLKSDTGYYKDWKEWAVVQGNDGYVFSAPVGSFQPNGFGLYDMIGNVSEWCHDSTEPAYYAQSPVDDPPGLPTGTMKSYRGGGWFMTHDVHALRQCRPAYRGLYKSGSNARHPTLGFRVALPIDTATASATASNEPGVISGHTAPVVGVAVSPDSKTIYTVSDDTTLRGWDVASKQPTFSIRGKTAMFSLAISADGKYAAAGNIGGAITVHELPSGKVIQTLEGHRDHVQGVAFNKDGQLVISAGVDGTYRLWNVKSAKKIRDFPNDGGGTGVCVCLSGDGKEVFGAGADGLIRCWSVATGKLRAKWPAHDGTIYFLALSPDGQHLAAAGYDKTVSVRRTSNGAETHRFVGHTDRVMGVDFFPTGDKLVSGGGDKKIFVWDLESKAAVASWPAHTDSPSGVRSIAVAPNGELIVSVGYDSKIRLWKPDGTPYEVASAAETSAEAASPPGDWKAGFLCQIYDGTKFEKLIKTRTDEFIGTGKNFDNAFGSIGPEPGLPVDKFSVRWLGAVAVDQAGTYTVALDHDDGARLWIDDQPVFDHWGGGQTHDESEVKLTAGWHTVRIDYYDDNSLSGIGFRWKLAGEEFQWIGGDAVLHNPQWAKRTSYSKLGKPAVAVAARPRAAWQPGFLCQIYDGADFKKRIKTRTDDFIGTGRNYEEAFGERGAEPGLPVDGFSMRWLGAVSIEQAGVYTFHLNHDDGARLWIDDQPVIDNWKGGISNDKVEVNLTKGWHTLRLDYFEGGSAAQIGLRWTAPGEDELKWIGGGAVRHNPGWLKRAGFNKLGTPEGP